MVGLRLDGRLVVQMESHAPEFSCSAFGINSLELLGYETPSLISATKGGLKHVLLNPKNPNLIPGVRSSNACQQCESSASCGGGAQRRGHEVHAQLWHARTTAAVFLTMGADWSREYHFFFVNI